jgi:hypothetical protein
VVSSKNFITDIHCNTFLPWRLQKVAFFIRSIFPKIREMLYQFVSNQGNISSIINFPSIKLFINGRVKILFHDSREKVPY